MARARRSGLGAGGQILMVALGAVAGLAIGMAIADRAGGLDGLLRRKRSTRQRRHRDDGWRGDERRSQSFDEIDDESELAPEAISHLHLRGRYPETARTTPPRSAAAVSGAAPVAAPVPPPIGTTDRTVPHEVELEERVLDVFRNDLLLAERAIDIGAVDEHTIELAGWVLEESEIAYAVTLAGGVPGVKAVESLLAVRPRTAG